MKLLAFILTIFLVGFTTEPLLQEIFQDQISDVSEHNGCCDSSKKSCCSDDCCNSDETNCDGNCQSKYGPTNVYTVSIIEEVETTISSVEFLANYHSNYSFTLPSIIWHPPQLV